MNNQEVARAVEAEATAVRCALHGQRHVTLTRAAYSLGTLGVYGALSKEHAYKVLYEAAQVAGMRSAEIQSAFAAGWESALSAAGTGSPPVNYLAESARVLAEIELLLPKLGRPSRSDPDHYHLKDRLMRLRQTAEGYERLAALQRGITPGAYRDLGQDRSGILRDARSPED